MDCGICVDVCPTDALSWVPQKLAPTETPAGLVAGIAELGALSPPPPGKPVGSDDHAG